MAKAKQVFTDASFKSDGIEPIGILAGGTIVFLVAGTVLASGTFGVPEVVQGLIQGVGRFFQVFVILLLASEGVFLLGWVLLANGGTLAVLIRIVAQPMSLGYGIRPSPVVKTVPNVQKDSYSKMVSSTN